MYLPTFYKLFNEKQGQKLFRYGTFGVPAALWGVWLFYPSIYNIVFTDIFPPAKGVLKRESA